MSIEQEVTGFLAEQTPAMGALAQTLREKIMAIRPDLEQSLSVKLGVIYFKHNGVVCALSLHKAHVNLHFYKGTELSDPHQVLQGSGKVLRHLKFKKPADIDKAILNEYVQEAYALNVP